MYDRDGIYGIGNEFFEDEIERHIAFQKAYLNWILDSQKPTIIHCHDHHTGLIPYMVQYCKVYASLKNIPVIFTIHNGQYHGAFSWDKENLLPQSSSEHKGLLDWNNSINSLASAIRCAWKINTVSPTYMKELQESDGYFGDLYKMESEKSTGVLNGIDYEVWNPTSDSLIHYTLKTSARNFKRKNKEYLIDLFGLKPKVALICFIGRFAHEKGVDIMQSAMAKCLEEKMNVNFFILGTGQKELEISFSKMNKKYPGRFHAEIKYDEQLAHQIYAGSDFLLMPSRVEPCGLNQMYSMRYGTIPIVHGVGGLEDSVTNFSDKNGNGIKFYGLNLENVVKAIKQALIIYKNKNLKTTLINQAMAEDFTWNASCNNYLNIYYEFKKFNQ